MIGQLTVEFVDGQTIGHLTGEFVDGQTIVNSLVNSSTDRQSVTERFEGGKRPELAGTFFKLNLNLTPRLYPLSSSSWKFYHLVVFCTCILPCPAEFPELPPGRRGKFYMAF